MTTRRFALVGCGRIGAPVLAAWQAGHLPGWELGGVLVRSIAPGRGALFTTNVQQELSASPEVIVEVAGPAALASIGEQLLQAADVWTTSAAALADDGVMRRLEAAAMASGHRLRVLPGAFAGFDGVASSAAAPDASLHLVIDLPPSDRPAALRFEGTVREAALLFPDALNVAVAAALAGPGFDATRIEVRDPGPVPRHRLALRARGAAGELDVSVEPDLSRGVHPVACSVIAALRREGKPVWVG